MEEFEQYAETIGNDQSFGHAKYDGNPFKKHLFRDQITFSKIMKNILGLSVLRTLTVGP